MNAREVTKSAPIRSATSLARSGFFSAIPIQSTCGWRAATSPRNRPTRPAPTIARPMRRGFFFGMAPCPPARERYWIFALARKSVISSWILRCVSCCTMRPFTLSSAGNSTGRVSSRRMMW